LTPWSLTAIAAKLVHPRVATSDELPTRQKNDKKSFSCSSGGNRRMIFADAIVETNFAACSFQPLSKK
jgi:hypothetical protein